MKENIVLSVLIFLSIASYAQKKNEIVQRGIEVKRSYEQNIKDGDNEPYLEKEEFYNFQGEIVEIKEYSNKGNRLEKWLKYKYDEEANLVEELELDEKGRQEERIEYIYKKGLKVEKVTYDAKNRLGKRKVYKYEFRK